MNVPIFSGSIGINNKVSPHRLPYDQETGVAALETGKDFIIDPTGAAVSKGGMLQVESGEFHSLFPDNKTGIVAKDRATDTAVYRIAVSDDGSVILNGIASGYDKCRRFDYCKVQDDIFYTNGTANGIFAENHSIAWKESEWPDERSNVSWSDVPASDHLCFNTGRIYFSRDNLLNYTEFGHLGIYDQATNGEQFQTKILVIAPAADGIYVSDTESIYFLAGLNPHEWSSRNVADYPALEWGKFHGMVNPSFFGIESTIPSALLATTKGPVICLPSGQIVNLIDRVVTMPDCPLTGAIINMDESLIIQTTGE